MSEGVYIKGMEMPTNGHITITISDDGEVVCNSEVIGGKYQYRSYGRLGKAVPVQPHGRLIDANVQDAQIEALIERHLHGYTKSTWDFVCELRDILKRNRIVIPAEEDE